MPAYTFFADQIPAKGQPIDIDREEKNHIRVMRLRPGDRAQFMDGRGALASAELASNGSEWIVLEVSVEPRGPERRIIIPFMRGAKLDWIVEKTIEFGVNRIQFFAADRSEDVRPKLERLSQLARGAVKQSGARWLPELELIGPVRTWKTQDFPLPLFFGSLRAEARRLPGLFLPPHWIWCAGPEGGWSDQEENALRALGGTPLRLADHILRAETAAVGGVACLTALQSNE